MGRKTFESLPGLLPGRRHIVLTRDPAWQRRGRRGRAARSRRRSRWSSGDRRLGHRRRRNLPPVPAARRPVRADRGSRSRPKGDTFLPAFDPAHLAASSACRSAGRRRTASPGASASSTLAPPGSIVARLADRRLLYPPHGAPGRGLGGSGRVSRRHRRARQFRRISQGPPGGGGPRRRARPGRGAAGAGRDLRSPSGPLLQARRAALPADHARPARAAVRRGRRGRDAGLPFRRRARPGHRARFRRRLSGQPRSAPPASSPARISPSARAAAAISRC